MSRVRLIVVPWVWSANGESAMPRSRRPRRLRWITADRDGRRDHAHEHEVVEARVRLRERRAGRSDRPEAAEHEVRPVEEQLQDEAEAQSREREEHPRHPHRGDRSHESDDAGDDARRQQGHRHGQAMVRREVAERGRPDRGEPELAQRQLARRLHEEAERQEQDHVDQRGRIEVDVVPAQRRNDAQHRDQRDEARDAAGARNRPRLARRTTDRRPAFREPAAGRHDQDDEEHDEGQHDGKRLQPVRVHVARQQRLAHADRDAADVRERDAGEPTDRGGTERGEHELADGARVGAEARRQREQHAGERGERAADDPCDPSHCTR